MGTPTKRQVSKRQVLKCPVSKRLKCQVYKTSGLQNVRFTKCQVYKTSGLQNVRLEKIIHSVLVVGGNPHILLQPCLQAISINDTLFTLNINAKLAIPILFV
jgi:hypothetical protein